MVDVNLFRWDSLIELAKSYHRPRRRWLPGAALVPGVLEAPGPLQGQYSPLLSPPLPSRQAAGGQ